jgi:hypothetical protein
LPAPAVAPGNIIQYYVIAQDSGVNITSNPLYAIASNVNTVTTVPTLNSYNITSPLDTILIVGPAPSNYLTLGAAFTAINAGVLQGNTRIFLKAGTIVESTTPTLNQWLEINNGIMGTYNYTLTIRPQTTALTTLSLGFNSITLNGADRVTFLGFDTLGTVNDSNLLITSTSTALNIQNDASGNTFRNVVFAGSSSYIVFISSASITTGNDNQVFDKCKFRSSNLPSMPSYCFWNSGTTGRENDSLLIQNCEFYNASAYQLLLNGGLGNMIRVKNNHFYQQVSSSLVANIYFGPGTISNNDTISGNFIGGTTVNAEGTPLLNSYTSQYNPIFILSNGSQTGTSVTNNIIRNINMTSTGSIVGILAQSGVVNISNNLIGDTTSINPKGISLTTTTGQSTGILGQSSSPITINNNFISNFSSTGNNAIVGLQNSNGVTQMNNNLVQNFTNTNIAGASVRLIGIQNSVSTISQINGNTVRNFLCNSAMTGTSTSAAVLGIMNNSATALSISNNTIQNLTNTNNTATNSMYGIYHSSGLATMSGNTVDGLTSSGTYTGTATIAGLGGIFNSSGTAGQTISNNIVRNLTQTGAITANKQVIGLLVSSGGQHTITGNTVQGIRSNSSSTSTLTGVSIIGMYITATAAQMVVSNNNINTLENTYNALANAVNITGMYYSNTITSGTNTIDRNTVHSLKANSLGSCGLNGMFINASTNGTFSNNMIRLGVDSNGVSFTNPHAINGMFVNTGNVND